MKLLFYLNNYFRKVINQELLSEKLRRTEGETTTPAAVPDVSKTSHIACYPNKRASGTDGHGFRACSPAR